MSQWTMHAELSISNDAEDVATVDNKEQDGNVVQMVYTWTTNPPKGRDLNRSTERPTTSINTARNPNASYGFQRGNMVFTSTPPRQEHPNVRLGRNVQDSGYNSDHLFSNNCSSNSQNSNRTFMPYGRRCKSTCSIILSTDINIDSTITKPVNTESIHVSTQPIPINRNPGCARPTCYNERISRYSTAIETCEECHRSKSVPSKQESDTFTTHFCTKLSEKKVNSSTTSGMKDMTTQTVETREKCTSPLEKIQEFSENKSDSELSRSKIRSAKKKTNTVSRRYSDLGANESKYTGYYSDRAVNSNTNRSITRSPGIIFDKFQEALKTRTVHIDVYCTASEGESDSDSTLFDSEEEMDTVFKSDKGKVIHRRAKKSELPYSLKSFDQDNIPPLFQGIARNDSYCGDDSSTAYPSAMSSYSTINDFEKSLSSIFPLLCNHSSSSCALSECHNSDASYKNSISDSESVCQRKNDSFTSCEKFDRKTLSNSVLPYSDSFEYADSSDRERIQRMEQAWRDNSQQKCWKSPQAERKHILQQQKIQEYFKRKLTDKTNTLAVDSEDSEDLNFISEDEEKERVRRVSIKRGSMVYKGKPAEEISEIIKRNDSVNNNKQKTCDTVKQPVISKRSFKTPFTNETRSDPLWKARLFGSVIGAVKKPGHHVGPAKNPDCLCVHCKTFYSDNASRIRTQSVGNLPFTETQDWRNILKSTNTQKVPNYGDC